MTIAGGSRRVLAARALVVVVLALLQMLGPLLHAHVDGRAGSNLGLHVHLTSAQQTLTSADRLLEAPELTPDEGAVVFLAVECCGDDRLQPLPLDSSSPAPEPAFMPPADASGVIRWPANRSQAPPPPSHLRPASTAPPRA